MMNYRMIDVAAGVGWVFPEVYIFCCLLTWCGCSRKSGCMSFYQTTADFKLL